jgi:Uma2 family endonuclease
MMPPTPAETDLLTVEDYRATPDGVRYQLVEGDLIQMSPAPNLFHQFIVGNIHLMLATFVAGKGLGKVVVSPCDVYLSEHDVFQPDVLFVSTANLDILKEDGVHGGPDLVIEVLSPSTAQLDKKPKRKVYARAGVKECWLVDPLLLQIQRYVFAQDPAKPVQLVEEDETFSTPLFPGLAISAAEIFKR